MELSPGYTAAWIAWAFAFAILEGSALLRPPGAPNGTLTWNVRRLLALGSRTKWAGRVIAIVTLAWLCWHFLYPVK